MYAKKINYLYSTRRFLYTFIIAEINYGLMYAKTINYLYNTRRFIYTFIIAEINHGFMCAKTITSTINKGYYIPSSNDVNTISAIFFLQFKRKFQKQAKPKSRSGDREPGQELQNQFVRVQEIRFRIQKVRFNVRPEEKVEPDVRRVENVVQVVVDVKTERHKIASHCLA